MIAVLDYGIGNLRSAFKALEYLGADTQLASDARSAKGADAVVLPGVGAFGPSMSALRGQGLDGVAIEAIESGLPFLGICVGLQMLYEGSEEDGGVPGLGVLAGTVAGLPADQKRPQMQWNVLAPVNEPSRAMAGLDSPAWVYFVHSYAPPVGPHTMATCDYGGPVAALVERQNLWATQFHPEKSGPTGLRILANFLTMVTERR